MALSNFIAVTVYRDPGTTPSADTSGTLMLGAQMAPMADFFIDNPGPGTWCYSMRVKNMQPAGIGGYVNVYRRSLIAQVIKR